MEFLKEFVEQENIKILRELFKLNNKKCTESEQEYKKELTRKLTENNKFLYMTKKERGAI